MQEPDKNRTEKVMNSINKVSKRILAIAVATVIAAVLCIFTYMGSDAGRSGDFVMNSDRTAITAYEGDGGSVSIPDGVTTIGAGAFMNTSVTVVDLNEVKTIGNNAFSGSTLCSVTGTGGVVAIGGEAFANTQLKAFSVPKSLKRLAGNAFNGDEQMSGFSGGSKEYPIYGGCVYADKGKTLLIVPRGMKDSLTVSKKAVAIADAALLGCENITEVYIPSSVKTFGGLTDTAKEGITLPKGSTIYGYSGSQAEAYAQSHGAKFVSMGVSDSMSEMSETKTARSAASDEDTGNDEVSESDELYATEDYDGGYWLADNSSSQAEDTEDEEYYEEDYYDDEELYEDSADYASVSEKHVYKPLEAAGTIGGETAPLAAADPISTEGVLSSSDAVASSSSSIAKSIGNSIAAKSLAKSATKSQVVTQSLPIEGEDSGSNTTNNTTNSTTNNTTNNTTTTTDNTTGSTTSTTDSTTSNSTTTTDSTTNNASAATDNTTVNNTAADNSAAGTVNNSASTNATTDAAVSSNANTNLSQSQAVAAVTGGSANTASDIASQGAHVRDTTPRTADISIRPSYFLCGAIFMVGLAGIFFARRQSAIQMAISGKSEIKDELD